MTATRTPVFRASRKRRKILRAALTYAVLLFFAAIVLFPFIVAVSTSLKEPEDVFNFPPTLIPRVPATVAI